MGDARGVDGSEVGDKVGVLAGAEEDDGAGGGHDGREALVLG